jgi:hypothetical protein
MKYWWKSKPEMLLTSWSYDMKQKISWLTANMMLLISCCIFFLVWGKYLWSLYAMKETKLWQCLSRVEETVAAYDVSIVNAFSSISHSSVSFNFFSFFFFSSSSSSSSSVLQAPAENQPADLYLFHKRSPTAAMCSLLTIWKI